MTELKVKKERPPILTVTPAAIKQMHDLLEKRGKESLGIRIATTTKGCSGLSYLLEYADIQEPGSDVITVDNIKLFIDLKAILYIIGSEIDYESDIMKSGFIFRNPNAKSVCGCNKSFNV